MNPLFALITATIVCGGLGWFVGAQIELFGVKKKIQKARDEKYNELKKLADFINKRGVFLSAELNDFVLFINDDLPNEITNIILAEPTLTILKERGGIPDKEYIDALQPIIINTQNIVAERTKLLLDHVTAETLKDMRGLME